MNKIIVVTGGSKGIGRAIIEKFASKGFDIITCSRNMDDLRKVKEDIEIKYPQVNIQVKASDLSTRKDVDEFGSFITDQGFEIDVLVNNTGVFIPGEVNNEEEGVLEKMIHTNLYSAYHLTRSLIAKMIEGRKGHVFNICSVASLQAYPNGGSYSISKFALYGFSKALREEMKCHNIRVTSVLPGATLTSSWDGVDLPAERFIKPKDVSEAIYSTWKLSGQTVIEDLILRPQEGDI